MLDRGLISLSDDLDALISRHATDPDGVRAFIARSGRAIAPKRVADGAIRIGPALMMCTQHCNGFCAPRAKRRQIRRKLIELPQRADPHWRRQLNCSKNPCAVRIPGAVFAAYDEETERLPGRPK